MEGAKHPYRRTPDYGPQEADTPDPNVSGTTYGNIPTGSINDSSVYGQVKPTAEQAAAGSRDNFPSGTYPANPTPMQGPGDNPATRAVMPKLQVQGDPQEAYGVRSVTRPGASRTVIDDKWDNQEIGLGNVARPSAAEYGLNDPQSGRNPPARIPNSRGRSGSSEVFRTQTGQLQPQDMGDDERAGEITLAEKGLNPTGFPYFIVFDWNGTIDARATGRGIPIDFLSYLQDLGKKVAIFTSSTQGPEKEFMRQVLDSRNIPYTDDEDILDRADVFIGDKDSDRRRAGKHGAKWIDVSDFIPDKLLSKSILFRAWNSHMTTVVF